MEWATTNLTQSAVDVLKFRSKLLSCLVIVIVSGYWVMDFEQDDDSGTFTLRIKSRSGRLNLIWALNFGVEIWHGRTLYCGVIYSSIVIGVISHDRPPKGVVSKTSFLCLRLDDHTFQTSRLFTGSKLLIAQLNASILVAVLETAWLYSITNGRGAGWLLTINMIPLLSAVKTISEPRTIGGSFFPWVFSLIAK